jgi:hypothetical protein
MKSVSHGTWQSQGRGAVKGTRRPRLKGSVCLVLAFVTIGIAGTNGYSHRMFVSNSSLSQQNPILADDPDEANTTRINLQRDADRLRITISDPSIYLLIRK